MCFFGETPQKTPRKPKRKQNYSNATNAGLSQATESDLSEASIPSRPATKSSTSHVASRQRHSRRNQERITQSPPSLDVQDGDQSQAVDPLCPAEELLAHPGRSRRSANSGHEFSHIDIKNEAKVHLGNVNAGVINYNNTSQQGDESPDDKRWEKFMNALRFDQMDLRRAAIEPAHDRTCRWIFDTPEYLRWRDHESRDSHRGVFWIKGNPGSGKSTIMKFLLESAQGTMPDYSVFYFFFNARGSSLEHSVEGMYRSLLRQILQDKPKLQIVMTMPCFSEAIEKKEWRLETLKDLFRKVVLSMTGKRLLCLVDALDEGIDQEQVRDMLTDFGNIAASAKERDVMLDTCFASRHYPRISIPFFEDIIVEDQSDHANDIQRYVRERLTIESVALRDELGGKICEKSQGIFLWVSLVVKILNANSDKGETPQFLVAALKEIPQGLTELLDRIITEDTSDACLLPILQWTLVAPKPMRLEELYFAVRFSIGEVTTPHWVSGEVDSATIRRFLLRRSKGLVNFVEDVKIGLGRKKTLVQFIHESVREHLKNGALEKLDPELYASTDVEAASHAAVARHCQDYIRLDPTRYLPAVDASQFLYQRMDSALETCPLFLHVLHSTFKHMEAAYANLGLAKAELSQFPLENWIRLSNHVAYESSRYTPNASLLYMLIEQGCAVLVKDLLKGHLLRLKSKYHGQTNSLEADDTQPDSLIDLHLNTLCGRGRGTSLAAAAGSGYHEIVQLLLGLGADVNFRGNRRSPLAFAAGSGHLDIVRLLLDHGADIETSGSEAVSPLLWAAFSGHVDVVRLLLDRGADVDCLGEDHDGPLSAAAFEGHFDTVQLLLDRGASLNRGGRYAHGHPLTAAAFWGHHKIVKLLLDWGADPNAASDERGPPLTAAAASRRSNVECVRLLLDHGADIHCRDKNGETALEIARRRQRQEIVDLLAAASNKSKSTEADEG